MNRSWNWAPKQVVLVAVFAAATFAVSFALGYAVTMSLGPGTSGVFTIVATTVLVVVCARIVPKKGVFTILVTLFTLMAIPTSMFGPPGPHKVIIGLLTGLVYDLTWNLTGRRRFSLPVAAAMATAASIALIFGLMILLGHPRVSYLRSIMYYIVPLYGALGFLGAWFGNWIYDKRIQGLPMAEQFRT